MAVQATLSGSLSSITAASDQSAFGLDANGDAYQLTDPSQPDEVGTWTALPEGVTLAQISATSGSDVWGVTSAGAVYRSQGATWNPQPVPLGVISQISAAEDGTVWGVHGGLAYQYTGAAPSGWTTRACQSPVAVIAVGSATLVCGLDTSGNVLWCTGGATWQSVLPAPPAPLTDISVTSDGLLWGVDASHTLLLYVGPGAGWYPADTDINLVSAASDSMICAVDTEGDPRLLTIGEEIFSEQVVAPRNGGGAGTKAAPRWDTESVYDQTNSTHLWIVYQAATLAKQAGEAGQAATDLVKPQPPSVKTPMKDDFHDQLCQGLYDADFKDPWRDGMAGLSKLPWGIGQKTALYVSHFYDPDTGKNWWGDTYPTALSRGRAVAAYALDCYLGGDMVGAGYYLGLALHYFTDATQPMHAANFTYLSSDPWGWHTEFEERVMALTGGGSVTPPATYTATTMNDFDEILVAAAANAKHTYFAQICPALVTEPDFVVVDGRVVITKSWRTDVESLWSSVLPLVPSVLQDSISFTAQFLVAWTAVAQMGAEVSFMVCADSGAVLDIPHAAIWPAGGLQQWSFNGQPNQQWMAIPLTGADAGYYRITSRIGLPGAPLVLDVARQSTVAGSAVITYAWNNQDNQKWKPLLQPDGSFKWQGKQSGLLLTVANVAEQGSQIVIASDGNTGQRWIAAPNTVVTLRCASGTLVADVPSGTSRPQTALQLFGANGGTNQEFLLIPIEADTTNEQDEVFVITVASSGLVLDVASGSAVVQALWANSATQRWHRTTLVSTGSPSVLLENVGQPGMVMSAAANGTTSGQPIVVAPANGNASQVWVLTSPS